MYDLKSIDLSVEQYLWRGTEELVKRYWRALEEVRKIRGGETAIAYSEVYLYLARIIHEFAYAYI